MGTIAEKLQYTLDAIDDIQLAIENKNDNFTNNVEQHSLASYASFINEIGTEGTATEANVTYGKTFYKGNEYKTGKAIIPYMQNPLASVPFLVRGHSLGIIGNEIDPVDFTTSSREYFTLNGAKDNMNNIFRPNSYLYDQRCEINFLGTVHLEDNNGNSIRPWIVIYPYNVSSSTYSVKIDLLKWNSSGDVDIIQTTELIKGVSNTFNLRKIFYLDSNVILLIYNYETNPGVATSITYMRTITLKEDYSDNTFSIMLSSARTLFPAHNYLPTNVATKSFAGFIFPNKDHNFGNLGLAYINKNFNASGVHTDSVLWQGTIVRSSSSTTSEITFAASSIIKITPSIQSLELYNSTTDGFYYKYNHFNSATATIRGYFNINNNVGSVKVLLGTGVSGGKAKRGYGSRIIGKLNDGNFLTYARIGDTGVQEDNGKVFYIERKVELNNYTTFVDESIYRTKLTDEKITNSEATTDWVLINNNILYSAYLGLMYQIIMDPYQTYKLHFLGNVECSRLNSESKGFLYGNNFLQIGEEGIY